MDKLEDLKTLKKELEAGTITKEEYQKLKDDLLSPAGVQILPRKKNKGFIRLSYFLFFFVFAGWALSNYLPTMRVQKITEDEFFNSIAPSGDVSYITIVNNDHVNVFIQSNPEKLTQYNYSGPQLSFKISSIEQFRKELVKANEDGQGIRSSLEYDKGVTDVFGVFGTIVFLIAIFGAWALFTALAERILFS